MCRFRNKIEALFEHFSGVFFDHKYLVFFIVLAFIGVMASRTPGISIDTSTKGFLPEDDPILHQYESFRDQFGLDEMAIVALEPDRGFDFLNKPGRIENIWASIQTHIRKKHGKKLPIKPQGERI